MAEYDFRTVIDHLRAGRYSVLDTIGCHEIRKEMKKMGWACRTVIRFARFFALFRNRRHKSRELALRASLGGILNWGAPAKVYGYLPQLHHGMIFGFNHPTLGEILRLVAICVTEYPERKCLFPVNLAWYETLAPYASRLEEFGIYIVPTIPPYARERMSEFITDPVAEEYVDKLARQFNDYYLACCSDFMVSDDIVLIAPSATRQATVFRSFEAYLGAEKVEPQTMTLIAMSLLRSKRLIDSFFVPIAVIPPKKASKRLNLFKEYKLIVSDPITPEVVERQCKKKSDITNQREFERYFLKAITSSLWTHLGNNSMFYPPPH